MSRFRVGAKRKSIIQDINKRARAKKRRLEKNYGVKTPEIQIKKPSEFTSYKEFKSYVEHMESFLSRTNWKYQFTKDSFGNVISKSELMRPDGYVTVTKGVKLTRSEYRFIMNDIERINKLKDIGMERAKSRKLTDRGVPVDYTIEDAAKMGDLSIAKYKPIEVDFNVFNSKKEIIDWFNVTRDSFRGNFLKRWDENYQKNYMKAIDNVFDYAGQSLKGKISRMPNDLFVEFYESELEVGKIDFVYDPILMQEKLDMLEKTLAKFVKKRTDKKTFHYIMGIQDDK